MEAKTFTTEQATFMKKAAEEAFIGMTAKDGGPFGAVIVKDGEIIASGHDMVITSYDPTAHAEIIVIREASKLLQRLDLSDCELYSSCEPCSMCLGAIQCAKIKKVYFGCSRKDAEEIGFDDKFCFDVAKGVTTKEQVESKQVEREVCLEALKEWKGLEVSIRA